MRTATLKCILACSVMAAAAACGAAGEKSTVLSDKGYIKVAGGCVAYRQGEIKFAPEPDGRVRVVVDNAGGWFYGDGSEPVPGVEATLSAEEGRTFFAGLEQILDHPVKAESVSTQMSVVEVYLPFEGRTLNVTWREGDGKYDVGPLLIYLQTSVKTLALR